MADAPLDALGAERHFVVSLAFPGQDQPFANAIEKPESEFLFELVDLPGQCRLRDVQAKRRFRDGTLLGNSDEGANVPQIHAESLCPFGMK